MDAIIDLSDTVQNLPTSRTVLIAYAQTAKGSMLRKLCVEYYHLCEEIDWFTRWKDGHPREFVFDVMLRSKSGPAVAPSMLNRCEYHEHKEGIPRCSSTAEVGDVGDGSASA